jgi:DNA-binding NarL/FixJ family response regulator
MKKRLIIYDDNEYLRNSISTMLYWNDEFEVIATMSEASNVLTDITAYRPDVIIMDIDMQTCNGVDAVALIRKNEIQTPVIMLTVFEDNDNIINAISAGANGYLLKKDIENIVSSIKDVLNGGAPLTSIIAKKVLTLFKNKTNSSKNSLAELTLRENEILNLMIKGNSQKMIANELSVSLDTVRTHLKNIYKKLQVNSAAEAIYKATH